MDADRTTNRRQFLTGQAATEALADLATRGEVSPSSPPTADPAAEPYLLQLGRRAMACRFEAYLNAGQYPHATQTVLEALDLIDQLEAQMTVYRDSSELANINRLAAQEPVRVERRLFELFERAAELHRQTRGAFDITSGPLTKVWGFFRRQGAVPGDADLAAALAKVSGDNLQLDANAGTTRFLVAGMELNLGAIGKGYALDRVAELMLAAGVGDFLWHGGQSSILARGSRFDPSVRWRKSGSATGPWARRVPARSFSATAANGTGISSIHAQAGPPRECSPPPCWPQPPPKPTLWPQPAMCSAQNRRSRFAAAEATWAF